MHFFRRGHKQHTYSPLASCEYALNEEDPKDIKIFGSSVVRDDENWHFAIVFPLIPPGISESKDWGQNVSVETMQEKLQLYFRPCVLENEHEDFAYLHIETTFAEDMTKREFHEAIRFVLATLLAGHHMGFKLKSSPSIDMDELLLCLEMTKGRSVDLEHTKAWVPHFVSPRYNTHEQLADATGMRIQLDPTRYPKDIQCPTKSLDSSRNFEGNEYVPASMQYSKERAKYFRPLSDLDLIRLCRLRMNQFIDFEHLMSDGVVKQDGIFCVHKWRRSSMFAKPSRERPKDVDGDNAAEYPHGFSSVRLADILQWPGDQHLNYVKEYFGEEIAFCFHWLSFFTRMLMVPTVMGCFVAAVRPLPYFEENPKHMQTLEISWMVLMILWSATFGEFYNRQSAMYIEAWGMADYQVQEVERPTFKKGLIGTSREDFRRMLHWFGILVVLAYTVTFNFYISTQRAEMLKYPDALYWFGYPGKVSQNFAKYIVTINITLVDSIWGMVSPAMSKSENHRTPVELRNAMVLKLIVVKVFVYYYPFWYIAFVQRHVEGCNIGGTTCLEYLESSLIVFLLLHIIFVFLMAGISALSTRVKIWRELRSVPSDKQYTFLEAQAKCPSYEAETEIADFLELITSLGLVMQFSIILPMIPLLQLLSNLVELRVSAYKMVNIFRRVPGRGSEGIGSWSSSIYCISWLALIVNVGLGVFFMKPMKDWDFDKQILTFVVVEHALVGLKVFVELAIPDIDILTHMIRITNNVVLEKVFSGDRGGNVNVQGDRAVPNMSLKFDADAQHYSAVSHQGLHMHGEVVPWLDSKGSNRWTSPIDWQVCGLTQRSGRNLAETGIPTHPAAE